MKKLIFILLFLIPAFTNVNAQTVDYLLEQAFKHSPVLKAQKNRTGASKESYLKESIFAKNPVFSFGYQNIPLSEWPSLDKHAMSGISLGISQYIAMPWEDTYRKRSFYNKYLSEKEALKDVKNILAFQVQSAYHNLLFLYSKKQILKENKRVLSDIQKVAESLVSVNKMNSSHLLKLRADISILDSRIIEVEGSISKIKFEMENLCGISLDWNISDKAVKDWINPEIAMTTPEGFKIKNHPLYKKMKALNKMYEAKKDLEVAKLSPGINIGINYKIRQEIPGMDQGEDFISITASTPIPIFYALKERHSIKAANEKKKEFDELLRKVEIELSTKWKGENENHQKLMDAFESYNKMVMPGYMAAYNAQLSSLPSGSVSLLDVLDAYGRYLKATLNEARINRDLMISKLRLYYLLYQYPGKRETAKVKEAKK